MPYRVIEKMGPGCGRTFEPEPGSMVRTIQIVNAETRGDWSEYYRLQHEFLKHALTENRVDSSCTARALFTLAHLEKLSTRAYHQEH